MADARYRMSEFAQLAQALAAAPDEDARLRLAVESAVALVKRCEHAGVTINEHGGLLTRVATDDTVQRANELQHHLGEGPCLDVMREQDTLVSPDLSRDERWPLWSKTVHDELHVGSMMSLMVYTDKVSFGALSLYAPRGRSFDADDVAVGQALVGHLAVIMTAGREIDQLGVALHGRKVIGQATGILMILLDIGEDQAFDYLRRVSSHSNRKISDIASEIVDKRGMPDLG